MYVFSGMQVIAEYTPMASTTAPSKEYIYPGGQVGALNSARVWFTITPLITAREARWRRKQT